MRRSVVALSIMLAAAAPALAQSPRPADPAKAQPTDLVTRKGWQIYATRHAFPELVKRLDEAVKKHKMAIVNAASASDGAKAQGFKIPGNRVVGVFRNDFARRILAESLAAGIEAPVRFYLVETPGGGSTLAYRPPREVFAPYLTRRTNDLRLIIKELDAVFAQIALDAI